MPRKDEIAANAHNEQTETVADMAARAEKRVEESNVTTETAASGRAEVLAEQEKPFMQQTLEEVPLVGDWLSEQFYGSARNTAPDADGTSGVRHASSIRRKRRSALSLKVCVARKASRRFVAGKASPKACTTAGGCVAGNRDGCVHRGTEIDLATAKIRSLWDGTGLVVKRIEHVHDAAPPRLRLKSTNPDYDDYTCDPEEAHIVGKVLWTVRRV